MVGEGLLGLERCQEPTIGISFSLSACLTKVKTSNPPFWALNKDNAHLRKSHKKCNESDFFLSDIWRDLGCRRDAPTYI